LKHKNSHITLRRFESLGKEYIFQRRNVSKGSVKS